MRRRVVRVVLVVDTSLAAGDNRLNALKIPGMAFGLKPHLLASHPVVIYCPSAGNLWARLIGLWLTLHGSWAASDTIERHKVGHILGAASAKVFPEIASSIRK